MPVNLGPGKKGPSSNSEPNNVVRLPQAKKPLANPDDDDDDDEQQGQEDDDEEKKDKEQEPHANAEDRAEDEALAQEEPNDPSLSPYIIFPSFSAMVQGTVNKAATHYRYCHSGCSQRIRWRENGRLFPLIGDPELGVFPQVVEGDWLVTLFQEQLKPAPRPPYYQKVPWDPRNTNFLVLVRIAAPMRKALPSPGMVKPELFNATKTQNAFPASSSSTSLTGSSNQGNQALSPNYLAEIIKSLPTTQHSSQLSDVLFKVLAQVQARDQMMFNHANEARERVKQLETELEKLRRKVGRGGFIDLAYSLFESNPDAFKSFVEQLGPAAMMLLSNLKLPSKQEDKK